MKTWNRLPLLAVSGLFLGIVTASACGGGEASTAGTGGSSSSSSSSSSKSSSSSSKSSSSASSSAKATSTTGSSSGSGGSPPLGGICESGLFIDQGVIDGCLSANCCTAFDPCLADAVCKECLTDAAAAGCDTNTLFQAQKTCFDTKCPGSICQSELGYTSPALNACISGSCCAEFTPCVADATCSACLADSTGPGCDASALYTSYNTCSDTNCPTSICTVPIGFTTTYDNGADDVNFASNKCAATNCCANLTACADPSGNGYMDTGDVEVDACIACLNGDPACVAGPVKTAATAFNTCFQTKCN